MASLKKTTSPFHLGINNHIRGICTDLLNIVTGPIYVLPRDVLRDFGGLLWGIRFIGEPKLAFSVIGYQIVAIAKDIIQVPFYMLKDALHLVASVVGLAVSLPVAFVSGLNSIVGKKELVVSALQLSGKAEVISGPKESLVHDNGLKRVSHEDLSIGATANQGVVRLSMPRDSKVEEANLKAWEKSLSEFDFEAGDSATDSVRFDEINHPMQR